MATAADSQAPRPPEFGVIVSCCATDYMFAYGTCASVRHILGDVPLCLIVDGYVPTRSFIDRFGARIITRSQVSDPFLRRNSFGWGYTKMNAFWESPWETFLSLDADTIVWGDILRHADFSRFDFIADLPRYERTAADVTAAFFDPLRLDRHFPGFPWAKYKDRYFCSGVFFGRRGLFSIAEYEEMLRIVHADPTFFFGGEQGFLNLMVFLGLEAGSIRVNQVSLQLLMADFPSDALAERFPVAGNEPAHRDEDVVLHWAGTKPTTLSPEVYGEPMRLFRRRFLQRTSLGQYVAADSIIRWQDYFHHLMKFNHRVQSRLRKSLRAQTVP